MSKGEELFGTIYQKGEVVFRQGELGDTMYIIQSGAVEVSQLRDDKKVVLSLLVRGDFFGEMSLIDKHPRTATVTTINRTRLLPFDRSSFLEKVRYDPGVVLHLLRGLSRRIVKTERLLRSRVEGNEALLSLLENSRGEYAVKSQAVDIKTIKEKELLSFGVFKAFEDMQKQRESLSNILFLYKDQKDYIEFQPGEIIFRQGDPGDTMYVILEGEVEISEESGRDRYLLAHLYTGEFFGETAILTNQPRSASASASAISRTLLLPIRRDEFIGKVQKEPELALYILQALIIRLRMLLSFVETPEKSMGVLVCSLPPALKKKGRLKTAIVSLSTCGGCPAALVEDKEELMKLLKKINITYCTMLIDESEIGEVEVSLVDGAVRGKEDVERLIEARNKSRYLVAWGTCATFGGIPAFANQYELEELIEDSYGQTQDPFAYYLSGMQGVDQTAYQERELKLLRRVGKLNDFVRVDYYVPGCPPQIGILNQLINELKGEGQDVKPRPIVCSECKRKTLKTPSDSVAIFPKPEWNKEHCFTSLGSLCMGFITKGGCGAICPRGGLPCWGCRGPSEAALKNMNEGKSFEELILKSLVIRTGQTEENLRLLLRNALKKGNSSLNFSQNFISSRSKIR
jgi:F420-non-reducing hydrogenase small subunit